MSSPLTYASLALCVAVLLPTSSAASTCFGTPANGRVANAVALPTKGANFAPYTGFGAVLGRTYVHAKVHDIITASYRELERIQPDVTFIYGETGLRHGGPMPPHRTHQAGISVDFMVPVRLSDGRAAELPGSVTNRFGYDLEFDSNGRLDGLRIDFDAIADHLYQLEQQARKRGGRISRVIFDPLLTRHLLASPGGGRVKSLPFMKTKPWIRHDEHYHVDFAIRCESRNAA